MKKGEYGYRSHYKRNKGIVIALFILAIISQYIASRLAKTVGARNILTVMAILTVLPMANLATPFLAIWKYKTPSLSPKNEVDLFADRGLIFYDFIITFREMILPLDFCLVRDGNVLMYLSAKGRDRKKAEKLIEENLKLHHLSCKIYIYDDFKTFLSELQKCSQIEEKRENMEQVGRVLKSLSV